MADKLFTTYWTELAAAALAHADAVGIEDTGGLFTATDVEGALAEVKTLADAAVTPAEAAAAYQPLDADLTALAAANNSTTLAAVTAAYTTAEASKLAGIEASATADQSASEILTAVKTVDGTGSGLDADLLDGNEATAFATASGLSDHISDATDAHDASAISVLDTGTLYTATDVEAALAEVKTIADAAVTPAEAAAAYQPLATVLTNTTASYTTAEASKLAGIEALADVTDTTNVTAAGALMDSEVDADIKTLSLPANTTISTFGASLVDDADNTAARTTLGLGTMATATATDYLAKVAGGASVENIGAVEENVEVASVSTTKEMDVATYGRAVYTMTADTTFSCTGFAPSGKASTWVMRIKGAFTPTVPASWDFVGGSAATYVGTGEGTSYVCTTEDGGTTVQVSVLAGWA